MAEPPDLSYLDSVVDEIWQGKRVLLAPPGTGVFVATNVIFTIGASLSCAAALPELIPPSLAERGAVQLTGIVLMALQGVLPAAMVVRGRRAGRSVLARVIELWLLLTGASVLYFFVIATGPRTAALLSTAVLALARYLIATRSYLVFTVFQERMARRRKEREASQLR